jgi:HK97 family phage portal protein
MGILKNIFKQRFHRMSPAQMWLADIEPKATILANSNAQEYRDSPIASACGRLIVKSVVDLPWKVGRLDKGIFKETPNSALTKLIRKPNAQQTFGTFLEKTIQNMLIDGEAYILPTNAKEDRMAKPQNLYSISSGVDPIEGSIEGQVAELRYTSIRGKQEKLSPKEMLYLRFALDPVDQFRGIGPMHAAVLSVATARKNIAWINGLAGNMGIPPTTMKFGSEDFAAVMNDENRAALRESWKREVVGPKNAGLPWATTADMKPLTWSPQEASVVEILKSATREIQRAFGVPPVLVGDLEFSSYANAREANTNFTLRNILPLGWLVANELTRWLQTWFSGEVLWIDEREIEVLQEDYKKLTEAISMQVDKGIISPNTAATELGYEEQDSDGEKRIVDGTKQPLSSATDEPGHGEPM